MAQRRLGETMKALVLGALFWPSLLLAADYVHKVSPGESLDGLGRTYYGSGWKSVYIAQRNAMNADAMLEVGQALVIPACSTYKVKRGDSLADIAKRLLGDDSRYKVLMSENAIRDATSIEVGQELLIPFSLRHTVKSGESLATLSRRYYRDAKHLSLIADYNRGSGTQSVAKAGDNLKPGEKLSIPIFDRATLDPKARRPTPQAPPAPPQQAAAMPKTAEVADAAETPPAAPSPAPEPAKPVGISPRSLDTAIAAYHAGRYDDACKSLDALLARADLSTDARIRVITHLAFCAVATGDTRAASDYFRSLLAIHPTATLDPLTTSPKILAVFESVRRDKNVSKTTTTR